ncbi:hypothetical protein LguiB_006896 [Lonicera macranthoides]
MEYQNFVDVLKSNVKDTINDYAKLPCGGEEGKMMVIDPLLKMNKIVLCIESSAYWFSSWSKFPFNEADFRWGKPEWTRAVDEDSDPLLAIQVTTFDCGGLAVGLRVSHRIADASTLSNFVNAWAAKSKGNRVYENHYPIFQSASYFPVRNLDGIDVGIPRNIGNGRLEVDTKMFFFRATAISVLREKAGGRHSKVQLVFALVWSTLMGVDKVKKGRKRASVILQPVNLREKTIPPIPKHSYGNLWGLAMPRNETGDFQTLVTLLSASVRKSLEEFYVMRLKGKWSKFPFYEADFGWEKPVWVSSVNLRMKNAMFLTDEREGDGIEAWLHLGGSEMLDFQQDANIRAYT